MPMIIKKDWLTIGEVSELTGVPIHTLRYWESEFDGYFSPLRTSGRQRRYDEEAVDRVLEIKALLKEEKYSIAGARQVLSRKPDLSRDFPAAPEALTPAARPAEAGNGPPELMQNLAGLLLEHQTM
ncbi:MAG: MerR family transcriptional regulator [Deltaproteobacteria bacterium]|nr:MerR family transcriptional regulator [Deltaproteobacteria bacterium]